MKHLVLIIIVFMAMSISLEAQNPTKSPVLLTSVCFLNLADHTKQGNITFTDSYSFKIGDNNQPTEVKAFRAKFTDVNDVASCLSEWRLIGFPAQTKFHVEFSWRHSVGWNSMRISTKNYAQVTIIESRLDDE